MAVIGLMAGDVLVECDPSIDFVPVREFEYPGWAEVQELQRGVGTFHARTLCPHQPPGVARREPRTYILLNMPVENEIRDLGRSPFRIGEWLVEPSLNRVSRAEETIQLELKVMDVLVCLAESAGEVVTRQEIVDRVWATEFIADNTLTHAVTEIRNALGDDARNPSFIETIHRRGYRLIASIEPSVPDEAGESRVARFPVPERAARVEEDRSPYPGLAAFTEDDAEFFFGREAEVSQMWRKLTSRRLLAVAGPSGVGKSSFLRAGVISAKPERWSVIICQPGEAPFAALARALVPEFSGDNEAMFDLVGLGGPEELQTAFGRWRRQNDQALLIVDQFEELFTLNATDTQQQFAAFLRKLVDDCDIHVVLSMRDDFLYRCHGLDPLRPVLDGLFLLEQPSSESLRRVLIEPALKLGFTFEDDGLPAQMIAEIEGERGALPMLAFAISRVWDTRDRTQMLLTRHAYNDIGGVGGALARHAESAIAGVGPERLPIIREIFRNLVTAEGTRAVREWDELLSVFCDSSDESPEEVLRQLIDARLLTSYETREADDAPTRRVEIVHESLLANWPRLVRWQTQDADAAQLRDQLRQAARTWEEHDRARDYLWTGKAFREFAVWRENYPGGLTELEEEFASSMTAHAKRRKRRRRTVASVVLVLAVALASLFGTLWRRSEKETRRAEAQYLVSLARQEDERVHRPEITLAYAIASLELHDERLGRDLALRTALSSPMPRITHMGSTLTAEFSPDGRWLAAADMTTGQVLLWSSDGGDARSWQAIEPKAPFGVWFTPDSSAVMTSGISDASMRFWSAPDGRMMSEIEDRREAIRSTEGNYNLVKMLRIVRGDDGSWMLDSRGRDRLRQIDAAFETPGDLSSDGGLLTYGEGDSLYLERLGDSRPARRLIGRHNRPIRLVQFAPDDRHIATQDTDGEMRLWPVDSGAEEPMRSWDAPEVFQDLRFGPSGSVLVAFARPLIFVYDLLGPPDAEPVSLVTHQPWTVAFHPSGRWLAVASGGGVHVWPIERRRLTAVLRGHSRIPGLVHFHPEGRGLVSSSADRTVRWWPLQPGGGGGSRVLFEAADSTRVFVPEISLNSTHVAVAAQRASIEIIPIEGGPPQRFASPAEPLEWIAIDPNGRHVAACGSESSVIRLWNLASGELRNLEPGGGLRAENLRFLADGRLLVLYSADQAPRSRLGVWDVTESRQELVFADDRVDWPIWLPAARDGRTLLGFEAGSGQGILLGDLDSRAVRRLPGFAGSRADLDSTGRVVAVWGGGLRKYGANLRVGFVDARIPHRIPYPADQEGFGLPAISPDARRVAQGYGDGSIRLYPVPDLSKPPLHTLPHEELIAKLKTFTNVRVVRDPESDSGWKLELGPFPGWEKVPSW